MENDINEYRVRYHKEFEIYPEYMDGFNSDEDADNPYELPLKINLEQIRIGMKEGPLTDEA